MLQMPVVHWLVAVQAVPLAPLGVHTFALQ
jgi:hypothetical protein